MDHDHGSLGSSSSSFYMLKRVCRGRRGGGSKRVALIDRFELDAWHRWLKYGVFPRSLAFHIAAISASTAMVVYLNQATSMYSADVHTALTTALFPADAPNWSGNSLTYPGDEYFIQRTDQLNTSLFSMVGNYYALDARPSASYESTSASAASPPAMIHLPSEDIGTDQVKPGGDYTKQQQQQRKRSFSQTSNETGSRIGDLSGPLGMLDYIECYVSGTSNIGGGVNIPTLRYTVSASSRYVGSSWLQNTLLLATLENTAAEFPSQSSSCISNRTTTTTTLSTSTSSSTSPLKITATRKHDGADVLQLFLQSPHRDTSPNIGNTLAQLQDILELTDDDDLSITVEFPSFSSFVLWSTQAIPDIASLAAFSQSLTEISLDLQLRTYALHAGPVTGSTCMQWDVLVDFEVTQKGVSRVYVDDSFAECKDTNTVGSTGWWRGPEASGGWGGASPVLIIACFMILLAGFQQLTLIRQEAKVARLMVWAVTLGQVARAFEDARLRIRLARARDQCILTGVEGAALRLPDPKRIGNAGISRHSNSNTEKSGKITRSKKMSIVDDSAVIKKFTLRRGCRPFIKACCGCVPGSGSSSSRDREEEGHHADDDHEDHTHHHNHQGNMLFGTSFSKVGQDAVDRDDMYVSINNSSAAGEESTTNSKTPATHVKSKGVDAMAAALLFDTQDGDEFDAGVVAAEEPGQLERDVATLTLLLRRALSFRHTHANWHINMTAAMRSLAHPPRHVFLHNNVAPFDGERQNNIVTAQTATNSTSSGVVPVDAGGESGLTLDDFIGLDAGGDGGDENEDEDDEGDTQNNVSRIWASPEGAARKSSITDVHHQHLRSMAQQAAINEAQYHHHHQQQQHQGSVAVAEFAARVEKAASRSRANSRASSPLLQVSSSNAIGASTTDVTTLAPNAHINAHVVKETFVPLPVLPSRVKTPLEQALFLLRKAALKVDHKHALGLLSPWAIFKTLGNTFNGVYAAAVFFTGAPLQSKDVTLLLALGGAFEWLRLIQYLKHHGSFYLFSRMFQAGTPSILRNMLAMIPIFAAFAVAMTMIFGGLTERFDGLPWASIALFAVANGDVVRETFQVTLQYQTGIFLRLLAQFIMYMYTASFIYVMLKTTTAITEEAYLTSRPAFPDAEVEEGDGEKKEVSASHRDENGDDEDANNDQDHGDVSNVPPATTGAIEEFRLPIEIRNLLIAMQQVRDAGGAIAPLSKAAGAISIMPLQEQIKVLKRGWISFCARALGSSGRLPDTVMKDLSAAVTLAAGAGSALTTSMSNAMLSSSPPSFVGANSINYNNTSNFKSITGKRSNAAASANAAPQFEQFEIEYGDNLSGYNKENPMGGRQQQGTTARLGNGNYSKGIIANNSSNGNTGNSMNSSNSNNHQGSSTTSSAVLEPLARLAGATLRAVREGVGRWGEEEDDENNLLGPAVVGGVSMGKGVQNRIKSVPAVPPPPSSVESFASALAKATSKVQVGQKGRALPTAAENTVGVTAVGVSGRRARGVSSGAVSSGGGGYGSFSESPQKGNSGQGSSRRGSTTTLRK